MIEVYKPETNKIFDKLNRSSAFTELLDKIESGERVLTLSGLEGSSRFYLASALFHIAERPVVYLSHSRKEAENAAQDISFYMEDIPPILAKRELSKKEALFSSSSNEAADRLDWLYSAKKGKIVIAEAQALFQKVMPVDLFEQSVICVRDGDVLVRDELVANLTEMGYVRTDFVERQGEISVRGSIVDVYSPGPGYPTRLEFLGDEIGSVRFFNTHDQRSIKKTDSAVFLPASEIILNDLTVEHSISYVKRKALQQGLKASTKLSLLQKIEKRERFSHIEWLLPSFYENLDTVFDYISGDALLVLGETDGISETINAHIKSTSDIERLLTQRLNVTPDLDELYISEEEFKAASSNFQQIHVRQLEIGNTESPFTSGRKQNGGNATSSISSIKFCTEKISTDRENFDSPFVALSRKIIEWQNIGYSVRIVLPTESERKKIEKILSERGVKGFETRVGTLSAGFGVPEASIGFITEKEIFGEKKKSKPKRSKDVPSAFLTSFSELKPGDYIVHLEFGIGVFRGLKRLKVGNVEGDFIECEYAGGDKIYVPVDKLSQVQRYVGDGARTPRVDKLGHGSWKQTVKRVRKAVENVARELLELYARRKTEQGYEFSKRDSMFREFEFEFPYEETPDQEAAIEEAMSDMQSQMPMDRLICGDVGFGKTEVALRAAFKAVTDGKQVAFLVPTTLLCHQHYETSVERLKGYPVLIDTLSRFKTGKEQRETLNNLKQGKLDIVIGTHKLLSDKIEFNDLGLVIIDEEQRFGVKQKEKLRKIKKGVDVLALSATPIPRTLQLSLAKIRDISLINTPPEGRQSVETYVYRFGRDIIEEAIKKELERNGSVFFIHNRIKDIHRVAEMVREIVPDAAVDVTHGRMKERRLEKAMESFIRGHTDVLVTTAIVESGLDIPRANTIIVNDAHKFGLADLYQLRGRVGRTHRQAYAYFLIPTPSALTVEAKRRLKAISEFKELGSGFRLALSDLEIRGAGALFGTEQSGHIGDVGLELYLDMLDAAIERLEGDEEHEEFEPEINTNLPAFIPDDYIYDDAERLLFYKKISSITSEEDISEIRDELNDRFGEIPKPAANLLKSVEVKLLMKKLAAEKIDIKKEQAIVTFPEKSPLYSRLEPSGRLRIYYDSEDPFDKIKERLSGLERSKNAVLRKKRAVS